MTGGEYYLWFDSRDSELRKILYKLENFGIVRFAREQENKKGWYNFKWKLTPKGIGIVKNNKKLQKYWNEGRVVDFYNLLLEKNIIQPV